MYNILLFFSIHLINETKERMVITSMTLLEKMEEENKKSGLFTGRSDEILFPLGFPLLDELLGGIFKIRTPEGEEHENIQLGIPGGTHCMFVGPSQSGKTTAAIQAAWNIVEPFGEDAFIIHRDAEKSTDLPRVQTLLGIDTYTLKKRYRIFRDNNTWDNLLEQIKKIAEEKESDPARYKYNTGIKDVFGNDIEYYIPTVFIVDSFMKFTSDSEDVGEISGLMSGGREAIFRGKFYKNSLEWMNKYNIIVFMIHHFSDIMPSIGPGQNKGKQLPFIPSGKQISGGDQPILLTSTIIGWVPINSKDELKTKELNGYDGFPVKALVVKTRTSSGGTYCVQEFSQAAGYDSRLTLMRFAKEKGLIAGRNPSCYFTSSPDVKFDTRCFLSELKRDPNVVRTLFQECKPLMKELIPVIDSLNEDDIIRASKYKQESRSLLRNMYK